MEPTVTRFPILFVFFRGQFSCISSQCSQTVILRSIYLDHNRSLASGSSESSVVAGNISEVDSLSLQGVKSGMDHAQGLDDDQGSW